MSVGYKTILFTRDVERERESQQEGQQLILPDVHHIPEEQ